MSTRGIIVFKGTGNYLSVHIHTVRNVLILTLTGAAFSRYKSGSSFVGVRR